MEFHFKNYMHSVCACHTYTFKDGKFYLHKIYWFIYLSPCFYAWPFADWSQHRKIKSLPVTLHHRFGQFISSTLPTFAVCEKFVVMEISNEEKIDGGNNELFKVTLLFIWPNADLTALFYWEIIVECYNENFFDAGNDDDFGGLLSANLILLRNRLLDNLLRLLFTTKEKCTVNAQWDNTVTFYLFILNDFCFYMLSKL